MNEEFVLDTPVVREFVADVQATIASADSPAQACEALTPPFAELLSDPEWLPAEYRADAPQSGMGGGIGQWLLYRALDQSLSLFSLVVPAGAETPHRSSPPPGSLAPRQQEDHACCMYARADQSGGRRPRLQPLIPPRDDIHRVRTTSAETSVSIHLLTNDTGCVWLYCSTPNPATPNRSAPGTSTWRARTSEEEKPMSEKRRTTAEEAKRVGDEIGVDWSRFDLEQFRQGMDVEFEHGSHDPQTDVTHD